MSSTELLLLLREKATCASATEREMREDKMSTGVSVAPAFFFGEAFALPREVLGDFDR